MALPLSKEQKAEITTSIRRFFSDYTDKVEEVIVSLLGLIRADSKSVEDEITILWPLGPASPTLFRLECHQH